MARALERFVKWNCAIGKAKNWAHVFGVVELVDLQSFIVLWNLFNLKSPLTSHQWMKTAAPCLFLEWSPSLGKLALKARDSISSHVDCPRQWTFHVVYSPYSSVYKLPSIDLVLYCYSTPLESWKARQTWLCTLFAPLSSARSTRVSAATWHRVLETCRPRARPRHWRWRRFACAWKRAGWWWFDWVWSPWKYSRGIRAAGCSARSRRRGWESGRVLSRILAWF